MITEMVSEEDRVTLQLRESMAPKNPDFDSFVNPVDARQNGGTFSNKLASRAELDVESKPDTHFTTSQDA